MYLLLKICQAKSLTYKTAESKRRPARSGPCFQKFLLMFMRASFQLTMDRGQGTIAHSLSSSVQTKNPSSTSGTKSSPSTCSGQVSAVPPGLRFQAGTFKRFNVSTFKPANVTLVAVTGIPGADYYGSPAQSSFEITGEFSLIIPCRGDAFPWTLALGFHLTLPTR